MTYDYVPAPPQPLDRLPQKFLTLGLLKRGALRAGGGQGYATPAPVSGHARASRNIPSRDSTENKL